MSVADKTPRSPWRLHGKTYKASTPLSLLLLRTLFNSIGHLLPRMMGRVGFWFWFRTYRFTPPARETRLLAKATDHRFYSHGKDIACWSWGKGPRVLLVHGWNGRGAQLGSFVTPLVNAGYRVMTLDLPAHGQSRGKSTDIFEVSKALCAIDQLHGPFAGVIAHSFGVPCVAAAIKDGLQTEAIVSISAPSGFHSLLKHFSDYLRLPGRVERDIEQRLHAYVGPHFWQAFGQHYTAGNQRSLLIHDKDDHIVPLSEAEQLAQHWPGAELMLTAGLGHRRILKNREVILRVVAFIHVKQQRREEVQPALRVAGHDSRAN